MSRPDNPHLLHAALGRLLPKDIAFSVGPVPQDPSFEFQEEAARLREAGNRRKREFVGGRACARDALEQVGFSRIPLLPDEYGVPVWPDGALGVISHSRGYCAAIAARSSRFRALGLDLEKTNRLSPAAMERTVHPGERSYVQGNQKKASLIFSAKEAFFKAQFPVWRTQANFHDLELNVDESAGAITIQHIDPRFPHELRSIAAKIAFRFSYFEDFVVSVCCLKKGQTQNIKINSC